VIEKIELVRRGEVRRAKLYYLRDLRGKAAKIRERRSADDLETVYAAPVVETPVVETPVVEAPAAPEVVAEVVEETPAAQEAAVEETTPEAASDETKA
jgi:hypothetical protein